MLLLLIIILCPLFCNTKESTVSLGIAFRLPLNTLWTKDYFQEIIISAREYRSYSELYSKLSLNLLTTIFNIKPLKNSTQQKKLPFYLEIKDPAPGSNATLQAECNFVDIFGNSKMLLESPNKINVSMENVNIDKLSCSNAMIQFSIGKEKVYFYDYFPIIAFHCGFSSMVMLDRMYSNNLQKEISSKAEIVGHLSQVTTIILGLNTELHDQTEKYTNKKTLNNDGLLGIKSINSTDILFGIDMGVVYKAYFGFVQLEFSIMPIIWNDYHVINHYATLELSPFIFDYTVDAVPKYNDDTVFKMVLKDSFGNIVNDVLAFNRTDIFQYDFSNIKTSGFIFRFNLSLLLKKFFGAFIGMSFFSDFVDKTYFKVDNDIKDINNSLNNLLNYIPYNSFIRHGISLNMTWL